MQNEKIKKSSTKETLADYGIMILFVLLNVIGLILGLLFFIFKFALGMTVYRWFFD